MHSLTGTSSTHSLNNRRLVTDRSTLELKRKNQSIVLQGERSHLKYDEESKFNTIATHGVESCIAVSLYNPKTKTGSILHIDHSVDEVTSKGLLAEYKTISDSKKKKDSDIKVTLVGGGLLSFSSVGYSVQKILKENNIEYTYDHYSYTDFSFPCCQKSYSVELNLENGEVDVYKQSVEKNTEILNSLDFIGDRRYRLQDRINSGMIMKPFNRDVILYNSEHEEGTLEVKSDDSRIKKFEINEVK